MRARPRRPTLARMPARVLVAGARGAITELEAADGRVEVIGHVQSLDEAVQKMGAMRPSVLVLHASLAQHEGLCSLPALRRASPTTAIVLPPAGVPGSPLVRAIEIAAADPGRHRDGSHGLTPRERDIVRLVALGHSSREIADRLVVSVRTVETHRARIRRRLQLSSRSELVRWALEHDLLGQ
jgi:two-component system response regulator NreC